MQAHIHRNTNIINNKFATIVNLAFSPLEFEQELITVMPLDFVTSVSLPQESPFVSLLLLLFVIVL